jgi:hypothetical protein
MVTLDFIVKKQLQFYVIQVGSNVKDKWSCAGVLSDVYCFWNLVNVTWWQACYVTHTWLESVFLQFCSSRKSFRLWLYF